MSGIVNKVGQWALRIAAGFVILLALLVGVARLLLPEASRFADDVRRVAGEASGFVVDFELLSAGVSLYGPELRLTGVTVGWPDGEPAFNAREIAVAIDISRLVFAQEFSPALVHVEGLQVDVEIDADGVLQLQGRPWSEYLRSDAETTELRELYISLEDIDVRFADRKRAIKPVDAVVATLLAHIDSDEVEIEAGIRPDSGFARSLEIDGRLPLALLRGQEPEVDRSWGLSVAAEDFRLDPWLKLAELSETPLIDSEGTARVAVQFTGRKPVAVSIDADISELVLAQARGEPLRYESVAGSVTWQRAASGWSARGSRLMLARDGRRWPASEFAVGYRLAANGTSSLNGTASFLRIDDLMPFFGAFAGARLQEAGVNGLAAGDVWRLEAGVELGEDGAVTGYNVATDFQAAGYSDTEMGLQLSGLSGEVKADTDGGTVILATSDALLGWDRILRAPLEVSTLEGLALWRNSGDSLRILANDLRVETPHGEGNASLELLTDLKFAEPRVDLTARASMADATNVVRYLPRKVPDRVLAWLEKSLEAGTSPATEFRLRGPLRKFPFRDDEGEFFIDIDFRDARLRFAKDWPAIENASGHLIFANESIYSTRNRGTIAGMEFRDADARLADLKEAQVVIDAAGPAAVDDIVRFLQNSPVARRLGDVFADVRAKGRGEAALRLSLPLKQLSDWRLQGTLDLADTSVWLTTLKPRLTELQGRVSVDNIYVSGDGLTGMLLDEPVRIRIEANTAADADFSHRASVNGVFPYRTVEEALGLPVFSQLQGSAEIKAAAMFPAPREGSRPFRLLAHSGLEGLSSSLPAPLGKSASERELFSAEVLFPEAGLVDMRLALERGLTADLDFIRERDDWRLRGGRVRLGTATEAPRSEAGIALVAYADSINVDDWVAAFSRQEQPRRRIGFGGRDRWQDLFASAELVVDDLQVLGYSFADTDVRATFGADSWDMQIAGPWVEGQLSVPYELDRNATITGDLARLLLIEPLASGTASATGEYTSTPVDMPGFSGTVADFALGSMRLGRLVADVRGTAEGLEARALNFSAPGFAAALSGDWKVVDSAQRSRLHVEMQSSDVQQTLRQLGLAPLIEAAYGSLVADLIWEGGPGADIVGGSTGSLRMLIRDGEIDDIDAGGGRLLGLLSVAALPRRLALDFTDLTEDKLAFSEISGDFRIDFGDAWTCNLGLEGDVADMALVGRTGLRQQDYNQVAVVRPHLSNLMPVPAVVLGGPTVGVAALLVSQIFKKPISGIGETYYTVSGDWNESNINRVQRSDLDTTPFADCEAQLPNLSPEEIAAIEGLLNPPPEGAGDLSAAPPATEQAAPAAATP